MTFFSRIKDKNEYSKLHKTKRFWAAVLGPLILFYIFWQIIYLSGNYTHCGTPACFDVFLNDFKFPLYLLSLIVPAMAIAVATHRSELSVKQIDELIKSNNFNTFIKHKEFVTAKLESDNKNMPYIDFEDPSLTYQCFYPKNKIDNIEYAPSNFEAFERELEIFSQHLINFIRSPKDNYAKELILLSSNAFEQIIGGRFTNYSFQIKDGRSISYTNIEADNLFADFNVIRSCIKGVLPILSIYSDEQHFIEEWSKIDTALANASTKAKILLDKNTHAHKQLQKYINLNIHYIRSEK